MKKISFFIFSILLIVNLPLNTPFFYSAIHKNNDAIYSFYVLDDLNTEPYYTLINNGGLGSIVRCDIKNSIKVKRTLNRIVGESVSFFSSKNNVISFVSFYNATIIKKEEMEEQIYVIYAYTNKFPYSILIDNEKVNLQIAYSNGVVTLGSPVILGDY